MRKTEFFHPRAQTENHDFMLKAWEQLTKRYQESTQIRMNPRLELDPGLLLWAEIKLPRIDD